MSHRKDLGYFYSIPKPSHLCWKTKFCLLWNVENFFFTIEQIKNLLRVQTQHLRNLEVIRKMHFFVSKEFFSLQFKTFEFFRRQLQSIWLGAATADQKNWMSNKKMSMQDPQQSFLLSDGFKFGIVETWSQGFFFWRSDVSTGFINMLQCLADRPILLPHKTVWANEFIKWKKIYWVELHRYFKPNRDSPCCCLYLNFGEPYILKLLRVSCPYDI